MYKKGVTSFIRIHPLRRPSFPSIKDLYKPKRSKKSSKPVKWSDETMRHYWDTHHLLRLWQPFKHLVHDVTRTYARRSIPTISLEDPGIWLWGWVFLGALAGNQVLGQGLWCTTTDSRIWSNNRRPCSKIEMLVVKGRKTVIQTRHVRWLRLSSGSGALVNTIFILL